MKTKKKISELELFEVDYFVALAEKLNAQIIGSVCFIVKDRFDSNIYSPTINPSQAWTIIEREGIATMPWTNDNGVVTSWNGYKKWPMDEVKGYIGKTSLESAMRCYCASIYGEEVEI